MTSYSTRSSSNSKANNSIDDDLSSLFHLSTIDITNQLNVMLDNESKVQYQCLDYLHHGYSTRGSGGGGSSSSRGNSSRSSKSSSSRSTSSASHNRHTKKPSIAIITTSSRSKIVSWLNNCVDYLNISRECVALSMSYVDRFMSSCLLPSSSEEREATHVNNVKRDHNVKKEHKKIIQQAYNDATIYQLVSLSSLFIAIKQLSSTTISSSATTSSKKRRDIDAVTLSNLSHNNYTVKEIVTMELVILDVLHWNIMDVTSYSIACYGVALLNKVLYKVNNRVNNSKKDSHSRRAKAVDRKVKEEKISKQIKSIIDFTKIQIESSITSYDTSTLTKPSTVAFAAILNSIELLDSSNKLSFTSKEKYVYYDTIFKLIDVDLYDNRMVDKMRDVLHDLFDEQYDGVVTSHNGRHDERKKGSSTSSPNNVTTAPQDRNDMKIKRKDKKKSGSSVQSMKSGSSVQSISSSKSPTGVDDLYDMSKKRSGSRRSSKSATSHHGSSLSSYHHHEASSSSRSNSRRKNRDEHTTKRSVQLEP